MYFWKRNKYTILELKFFFTSQKEIWFKIVN